MELLIFLSVFALIAIITTIVAYAYERKARRTSEH